MTLSFPNPSRNFDRTRNAVRFTGYDGMFEVLFFVEVAVLERANGPSGSIARSEPEYLGAFDAMRAVILKMAHKIYTGGHRTSYILRTADFR